MNRDETTTLQHDIRNFRREHPGSDSIDSLVYWIKISNGLIKVDTDSAKLIQIARIWVGGRDNEK